MPRIQEFERGDVLDKALNLFWVSGYEASSISKLLDVMSLNRGSLYCAFKDKRSLFQEVLERYYQGCRSKLFMPTLVGGGDPLESFREFFYRAFIHVNPSVRAKGCLLFNTVSELSHNAPELADDASGYIIKLRTLILNKLERSQKMGRIDTSTNIETQANVLLGMLAGLRMQSKMGFSTEELKETIDTSLERIFNKKNISKKH